MTSPVDLVYQHHPLPFKLFPFQIETANELGPKERGGYYMDVGSGKTATSTATALYKKLKESRVTLVVMPPILILMWSRWLAQIPGITQLVYRGSPAKRAGLRLDNVDFILMSMQIFKKDYDHITNALRKRKKTLIVDEATSIKNPASDNHRAVFHFVDTWEAFLMLLTGTPLSTPADAYAYIKLVAPGTYRNLRHFENVHVAEYDFFGKVSAWQNLELLNANMKINSVRILREDVLKDLPQMTFTPLYYPLAPKHKALYTKLATEELIELEAGGKLDATTASALFHALGQIVCNWDTFGEDESLISAIYEMIEEIMEELGDKKLVVVAKYKMTNRQVLSRMAKYGAVGVFGDLTVPQQNRNIDRFINDPTCRLLTMQPTSGGFGVDGLQHVCHDMIFIEMPDTPPQLTQVVARLQRGGQHNPVNARLAVAEGTLQVRQFERLMDKDALVNRVTRSFQDLRDAVFGGS